MKKLSHIYFLLPFLFVLFFSKSSSANIPDFSPSKKQVFEIKTSAIILSDFEDTNEYQDKTRFNPAGFSPFTRIKRTYLSFSLNSPEIFTGVWILGSSQRLSLIRVFRL